MRIKGNKGITLVEIMVSVAILAIVVSAIGLFQRNVFSINSNIRGSINAQLSARAVLREFTSEVREAEPSSLGAFPVAEAATSSFAFYSDTDDDGDREYVRYYIEGNNFKKRVIHPSGNPLTYNPASQQTEMIIGDIVNGATPVFQYYGSTYDGTGSPLSSPISASSIRLVKMTLLIDEDPNRLPDPFNLTTQVSIRNLKDNH